MPTDDVLDTFEAAVVCAIATGAHTLATGEDLREWALTVEPGLTDTACWRFDPGGLHCQVGAIVGALNGRCTVIEVFR